MEKLVRTDSLQFKETGLVISLPIRQETAWARISEAFRNPIKVKSGPLGGMTTLIGTVDGDNIAVHYTSLGRSLRNHRIFGILSRTPEGSQLTLSTEDHGFSRVIVTFLVLSLVAGAGALFAAINDAPMVAVTALGGASVGLGIGVVRLAIGYREKKAALRATAEILTRIASGQIED
jgi:hypothetical protein